MIKFISKSVGGKIEPLTDLKKKSLQRILKDYETLDKAFLITIEPIEKQINKSQESLYKAFIFSASKLYDIQFGEMESILTKLHPLDTDGFNTKKPLSKWTTNDLNSFIEKATALMSADGLKF